MTAKQDKTKYKKTRQNPPMGAGQGNPIGGKGTQEQSKDTSTLAVRSFTKAPS